MISKATLVGCICLTISATMLYQEARVIYMYYYTDATRSLYRETKHHHTAKEQPHNYQVVDYPATTVRPPPSMYPPCEVSARVEHLRSTCRRNSWVPDVIDWKVLGDNMFLVDDKHRIMYCMVPKAATHTFRVLLATLVKGSVSAKQMYPMEAYVNYTGFRLLQFLPVRERERVLSEYYKVITVRHPLDRLRAVYSNKLYIPGMLNKQALKRNVPIINRYLRSTGKKNADFDPWKDILTFEQFVHLVSHEFKSGFVDEHWLPVDDLCKVCHIQYDAVYHVETLNDDMVHFNNHLTSQGETLPGHMTAQNVAVNATDSSEKLRLTTETFIKIPTGSMDKLVEIYHKDFELFAYHWEKNRRASCKLEHDQVQCC